MSYIILYSTNCPNCKELEAQLKEKNIDFEIITDLDEMIKKGFMSAPILEVDGKVMIYTEAMEWVENI